MARYQIYRRNGSMAPSTPFLSLCDVVAGLAYEADRLVEAESLGALARGVPSEVPVELAEGDAVHNLDDGSVWVRVRAGWLRLEDAPMLPRPTSGAIRRTVRRERDLRG